MRIRKQLDDTIEIVDQAKVVHFADSNISAIERDNIQNINLIPMPQEIALSVTGPSATHYIFSFSPFFRP